CCVEGSHRILVYEFVENNSLASSLLGLRDKQLLQLKAETAQDPPEKKRQRQTFILAVSRADGVLRDHRSRDKLERGWQSL
ncbi:hypothetical protein HN51_045026, partial [Arachis hypogaea]